MKKSIKPSFLQLCVTTIRNIEQVIAPLCLHSAPVEISQPVHAVADRLDGRCNCVLPNSNKHS